MAHLTFRITQPIQNILDPLQYLAQAHGGMEATSLMIALMQTYVLFVTQHHLVFP